MYTIFAVLMIITSILLVLVVLVQNPKGGGLSSSFGGGAGNQIMGAKRTTIQNLQVIDIDEDNSLMVIKGSVPGKPGSLLNIRPTKRVGVTTTKGVK